MYTRLILSHKVYILDAHSKGKQHAVAVEEKSLMK